MSLETSSITGFSQEHLIKTKLPSVDAMNIESTEKEKLINVLERLHDYYRAEEKDERPVYVEPELGSAVLAKERIKAKAAIDWFVIEPNKLSLLLIGEAGSGKTLISKEIISNYWSYYESNKSETKVIPIRISLPSLNKEYREHAMLETYFKSMGLLGAEIGTLQKACQNGECKLLIILDGFDEIQSDVGFYDSNSWLSTWGAPKVITTSRPEVLLKNPNYKDLFTTNNSGGNDLVESFIQPFSDEQIAEYLDETNGKDIFTPLIQLDPLKKLARNPLILSMLVKIAPGLGYRLEVCDDEPSAENINSNLIYLYLNHDEIYFKAKDPSGEIQNEQITMLLSEQLESFQRDLTSNNKFELSEKDKSKIFSITAKYNLLPSLKENSFNLIPYTRKVIYSLFISYWLDQQIKRVLADPVKKIKLLKQYKLSDHGFENGLKECLYNYLENLARFAWNKGKGKLDTTLTNEETLKPELLSVKQHGKFFLQHSTSNEIRPFLEILRSCSLLKFQESSYHFWHKSFLEFFASEAIFKSAATAIDHYVKDHASESILDDFALNDHILTDEQSILNFLADLARTDTEFRTLLYEVIELSKSEHAVATAAANAITILKLSGQTFSGKNFTGIRIPGADLSHAVCDTTNFSEADLTGVNFENAWLANANFDHSILKLSYFNRNPVFFDGNSCITAMAIDPFGKWLLLGTDKGNLFKVDSRSGEILQQYIPPVFPMNASSDESKNARGKNNDLFSWFKKTNSKHSQSDQWRAGDIRKIVLTSDGKQAYIDQRYTLTHERHDSNEDKILLLDTENFSTSRFLPDSNIDINPKNRKTEYECELGRLDTNWYFVVFNPETKKTIQCIDTSGISGKFITDDKDNMIISNDNNYLATISSGESYYLDIWDVTTGQIVTSKLLKDKPVKPVLVSHNGKFYFSSADGVIKLTSNLDEKPVVPAEPEFLETVHDQTITSLTEEKALKADSLIDSQFTKLKVVLEKTEREKKFCATTNKYRWHAITENYKKNSFFISQNPDFTRLYCAISDNKRFLLVGAEYTSNNLFGTSHNADLTIIDLEKNKKLKIKVPAKISCMKFSENCDRLVIASEENISVWDLNEGKTLHSLKQKGITTVIISKDNGYIATITPGDLSVWDMQHNRCIYSISVPLNTQIAFGSDNHENYLNITTPKNEKYLFRIEANDSDRLTLIERSGDSRSMCSLATFKNSIKLSKSNEEFLKANGAIVPARKQPPPNDRNDFIENSVDQFTHNLFLPRKAITFNTWSLSIIRDPRSEHNPNHVYLLLETMNEWGRLVFYRFDLATKIGDKAVQSGYGKVTSHVTQPILIKHHRDRLNELIASHQKEGLRRTVETVLGITWAISREKGLELIKSIEAEKDVLVPFSTVGKNSIISFGGHNCYTWAVEKLRNLNLEEVNDKLKNIVWDKIAVYPTLHLKHSPDAFEEQNSSKSCSTYTKR